MFSCMLICRIIKTLFDYLSIFVSSLLRRGWIISSLILLRWITITLLRGRCIWILGRGSIRIRSRRSIRICIWRRIIRRRGIVLRRRGISRCRRSIVRRGSIIRGWGIGRSWRGIVRRSIWIWSWRSVWVRIVIIRRRGIVRRRSISIRRGSIIRSRWILISIWSCIRWRGVKLLIWYKSNFQHKLASRLSFIVKFNPIFRTEKIKFSFLFWNFRFWIIFTINLTSANNRAYCLTSLSNHIIICSIIFIPYFDYKFI